MLGWLPHNPIPPEGKMAHSVDFSIPARDLGRSDVEFNVNRGDGKLGTLKVSKGSVVWFPFGTSYGYKLG
jgi:hypothetical protein